MLCSLFFLIIQLEDEAYLDGFVDNAWFDFSKIKNNLIGIGMKKLWSVCSLDFESLLVSVENLSHLDKIIPLWASYCNNCIFHLQKLCIFILAYLFKEKITGNKNKSWIVPTVIYWHTWHLTSLMKEAKVLVEPTSCQWHMAKLRLLHCSVRRLTDFPYKCWHYILQPQSTHFSWKMNKYLH